MEPPTMAPAPSQQRIAALELVKLAMDAALPALGEQAPAILMAMAAVLLHGRVPAVQIARWRGESGAELGTECICGGAELFIDDGGRHSLLIGAQALDLAPFLAAWPALLALMADSRVHALLAQAEQPASDAE